MITKQQLFKKYVEEEKSTYEIAKDIGTYAGAIRRLLHKYEIPVRDLSSAQKMALEKGRSSHPTEGKKHSEEAKKSISEKNYSNYYELTKEEKQRRSNISKKRWEERPEEEKEIFRNKGIEAVRETATHGSKLEKFICAGLIRCKYPVDFHKQFDQQHIDIFISKKIGSFSGVAIEVNGPSHYKEIWGSQAFERQASSDAKKFGFFAGKNFLAIVVKNISGKCSQAKMNIALKEIIDILELTEEGGIKENYYEVEITNGKG